MVGGVRDAAGGAEFDPGVAGGGEAGEVGGGSGAGYTAGSGGG